MEQIECGAVIGGIVERRSKSGIELKAPRTVWNFSCTDKDGNFQWEETLENLVFDDGINDLLTQYFKGAAYTASWFVGLVTSPATYAAADTMASHAGWTEATAYAEATRQGLTLGTVAAKSVDNTASKAVFNANGTVTVGGAFLCSDNTKGGTTGVLYCGVDFALGAKPLTSGDILSVTITLTGA